MQHQPVLLNEVIEQLAIKPDGIYIDGTFGRGGHAEVILKNLGPNGQLIAFDKDLEAIKAAQENPIFNDARFSIKQGSFTTLLDHMESLNCVGKVAGILLDLGVSSPQLDDAERGFSFLRDGPLDMRMDTTQDMNAASWINSASEREISFVLKEYGEERYAPRIAAAIVKARDQYPITTTGQLAEIVAKAHPRWEPHKHPATRAFQAIRIFVNSELDELRQVLEQCLTILAIGGRLLTISFHSLEDRIVKEFIAFHGSGNHWPRDLPITQDVIAETLRVKRINGAIRASATELEQNPRSRSAILRIMEKLK